MKKTAIYCLCIISSILLIACGNKTADNNDSTEVSLMQIESGDVNKEQTLQENTTENATEEMQEQSTEEQTKEKAEEISQNKNSVAKVENEEINNAPVEEEQPVNQEESRYTDTGDATLNNQCDKVLDSILSDSMSEYEKARAIYTWVENHIRYSGNTAENGWVSGAKTTLSSGKGNCYGYYSVSAALLTRAGLENLQVNEPDYSHYWNLVKVDGNWYHWDTTAGWGGERFLLTDAQMDNYSYYNASVGETLVYTWDHSSVPNTP